MSSLVITNKLLISTAYKYVAMAMMMTNCNLFVQQTDLPQSQPIAFANIILERCSVAPPRLMGFGGSIVTSNYFFGFGHNHLANFWQWEFHAESIGNIRAKQIKWSQQISQIGTNEVSALAVTWLNNMGIDTQVLEQKYPCKITQRFYYKNSNGSLTPLDKAKVMLPIFEISWGSIPLRGHPEYNYPAITVTIFGPTKELIEYHLMDDSLMLRPKLAVQNSEMLLSITNEAFDKFNEAQRNNLVKQFGVQSP
jgi:hypothetical protein